MAIRKEKSWHTEKAKKARSLKTAQRQVNTANVGEEGAVC